MKHNKREPVYPIRSVPREEGDRIPIFDVIDAIGILYRKRFISMKDADNLMAKLGVSYVIEPHKQGELRDNNPTLGK